MKNLVIGIYNGDPDKMHPESINGPFSYVGGDFQIGITPIKVLSAGINGQISYTSEWTFFELGPVISIGVGTPVSGGARSNLGMEQLIRVQGAGTGTYLLNSNIRPTEQRSYLNLFSAPMLWPGFR
jgi:hypothetical protein